MLNRRMIALLAVVSLAVEPGAAQSGSTGRVASSAAGEVGQRRTQEQPVAGIQPMARVRSRIQNRVNSRVYNRVDRYYDPQASAASPFEVAGDQARTAGRATRR